MLFDDLGDGQALDSKASAPLGPHDFRLPLAHVPFPRPLASAAAPTIRHVDGNTWLPVPAPGPRNLNPYKHTAEHCAEGKSEASRTRPRP